MTYATNGGKLGKWGPGAIGGEVVLIQRWIYEWAKAWKITLPSGFRVNGSFDASTSAALRLIQQRMGVAATGRWDAATGSKAINLTRYVTGGKSSDPFAAVAKGRNTIEEDRRWVVDQYQALYGRKPTANELQSRVSSLQAGRSRASLTLWMEKQDGPGSAARIFKEVMGREPTPAEVSRYGSMLTDGKATRTQLRALLSGLPEALLRDTTNENATEEELDAKAHLEQTLDEYGLGELKDWAWEQIVDGKSPTRILQDLRQQDAYKQRFAGMEARRQAGLSAISEAEYLDYERTARQLMQRAGLPADFYDQPADFAALIGQDIAPVELQARINEGWARVNQAPVEVQQVFEAFYGIAGPAELAAYFLDPDRREPELLRRAEAARMGGFANLYELNLGRDRAEELFDLGVDADRAQEAFARVGQIGNLFTESVSEDEDLTAEEEGLDATLGLDGQSATALERRRSEREASLAGGGGALAGRTGFGLGAAE